MIALIMEGLILLCMGIKTIWACKQKEVINIENTQQNQNDKIKMMESRLQTNSYIFYGSIGVTILIVLALVYFIWKKFKNRDRRFNNSRFESRQGSRLVRRLSSIILRERGEQRGMANVNYTANDGNMDKTGKGGNSHQYGPKLQIG